MDLLIKPRKLSGIIDCIPSKSYSHRAIIAASLADGVSTIKNLLFSDDVMRTIEACRAFGAQITISDNRVTIKGTSSIVRREKSKINVGESGSTIRFFIPIMLVNHEKMEFSGLNHLVNRSLEPYFNIFEKQGIDYTHPQDAFLPLNTEGKLKPDTFYVPGNISSQFITGLLFALPLLDGDSKIIVTTELESRSYIGLTLDILSLYGINIVNNNYQEFIIKGKQKYLPHDYVVEGDFSQAAFFLTAGFLGNDVKLRYMNIDSLQGDKVILDDLKALGGYIHYEDNLLWCTKEEAKEAQISLADSPDIGPILGVACSMAKGESLLTNCYRLRLKECDRLTCTVSELNKIGAIAKEYPNMMSFRSIKEFNSSLEVESHNDHRIAMSIAIASTCANGPILLRRAECVKKSYPTFWDDFKKLGGEFDVN